MKPAPVQAWPSTLNPCPTPRTPGHWNACNWDVGGRVTKVCNGCVYAKEHETGDRMKALQTFTSDPSGNPCT